MRVNASLHMPSTRSGQEKITQSRGRSSGRRLYALQATDTATTKEAKERDHRPALSISSSLIRIISSSSLVSTTHARTLLPSFVISLLPLLPSAFFSSSIPPCVPANSSIHLKCSTTSRRNRTLRSPIPPEKTSPSSVEFVREEKTEVM
ncbi:hypothetical protein RTBOTA2_003704 [Rhodotorula toruloides]|nr:hypothetical protein RTBOTA2_003704 [Rhodotorula toruloides]